MPYLPDLIDRFWDYRGAEFAGQAGAFDRPGRDGNRPPVFTRRDAERNILTPPDMPEDRRRQVIGLISRASRHRWFGSMRSSQALAQSVFGTLQVMGKADLLADLHPVDDPKKSPFLPGPSGEAALSLEVGVEHLGEPRPTSLDVVFHGARRVAIECKLTESDVGRCSRPKLKPGEEHYCNGDYCAQNGRTARCSLAPLGVRYWHYLPRLFTVDPATDHTPCPIRMTYQLVRSILGACITPGGGLSGDVVVLLYDDRNPAFRPPRGIGYLAFTRVRAILREEEAWRLQRCTWQDLFRVLRVDPGLQGFTDLLERKYGL